MKVTNVTTEHSRISTSTTRMARPDSTIAADHHPRLTIKRTDVRVHHRVTNNTGAAVANDLHVKLDGTDAFLFADLFHVLEFVFGMSVATDDGNIRWSTHVCQPTCNIYRIVMTATRNKNSDRRAPRI